MRASPSLRAPSDVAPAPTLALRLPAGANGERARAHNRRLTLGRIRANGPMGRAEIARACGLSTQAVSNIVEGLERDGMLAPVGTVRAGRGQPSMRYALVPAGGRTLGIELRPDAVLCAALDFAGAPVATGREALPDPRPGPAAALVARLARRIEAETMASGPLLGVGVALPGPFGPTGLVPEGGELPGWAEINAADHLAAALGGPVTLTKDASAAATAEMVGGVARGVRDFAHLYFGAGIGLALVVDGVPVTGANGNAGEIGRLPLAGTTTLEDAASRLALARRLAEAGVASDSLPAIEAAIDHRATAAWLGEAAPAVALAVRWIENLCDPETLVLGGAMPPALIDRLIETIDLPRLSVAERPERAMPRLVRGRCGPTVAAEGAAALVLDAADAPPRDAPPRTFEAVQ